MKLRRLAVERLPGIDRPFALDTLGDGLNIVVGPNGIGKSRLCAVVRALLWRERQVEDGGLAAHADFEHEGTLWHVRRDGSIYEWQCDGEEAARPTLPGERLEACFFLGLRDLLDDSDRAGRDLAGEIRRQMSGGFDLDVVRREFEQHASPNVGRKESRAVSAAEQEIRTAETLQVAIQRQGDELDALQAGVIEARRALTRLGHCQAAVSLQGLRRDLAERKADLDALPPDLANLDGKEIERFEKLDDDLGVQRRDREGVERRLAEYREAANGTGLDASVDPAVLTAWRERAERLAELERDLAAATENVAGARAAAEACRKVFGGTTEGDFESPPAIGDDFDLFAFLRDQHQLTTERQTLKERIGLLATRGFSDDDTRRLELLRRGVHPLRAWLRAPDSSERAASAAPWPTRVMYLVAGVVFAALGLGLYAVTDWPALLLVGTGLGLLAAGLFSRVSVASSETTDWKAVAEQQFPETLDTPGAWIADAVAERLQQIEDELVTLLADERRARAHADERTPLEESLKGLAARAPELEARRRVLATRLGVDALRPDAEMVEMARALDALRAADANVCSADARRDEVDGARRQLLGEIAVFLERLGEAGPIDAASARAGVHALEDRDRILRGANTDERREVERAASLDREIEKLNADRQEIFRIAGITVDDRAELARRLDALPRYRELTGECAQLAGAVRRAEADLDAAGARALADLDADQLADELAALRGKSEKLEDFTLEIGRIGERVDSARAGHTLEDAIAKKSQALRALRDCRDQALAATAGTFLIDGVRREHETNQMPRVYERARDHFAAFTHHRYELKVSRSDDGSFLAVDARDGARLGPAKLSDGTRAQLILAARLAFAEEAEQGAVLPLFLDEALDHSDPERFHAIARCLARLIADDGRQVFYLSNDPTDVERFRVAFDEERCDQLTTVDLGGIRGQAARVDGPEALHVAALPAVPRPGDQSAESYGAAIGVAPLDPQRESDSQHLYYVLRDDLSVLHELLVARVETVGQCRNLLRGGSALAKDVAARGDVGAQLEARSALLETFCLAWREGRGRKVGRAAIEESAAVTEKFLGTVVTVAAELDGDAGQLILALRERKDPRLSGYRTKSADELERFFAEHGYIDDTPILSERDIVERAIGTPAANQLSPRIAAELVHQWWELSAFARAD